MKVVTKCHRLIIKKRTFGIKIYDLLCLSKVWILNLSLMRATERSSAHFSPCIRSWFFQHQLFSDDLLHFFQRYSHFRFLYFGVCFLVCCGRLIIQVSWSWSSEFLSTSIINFIYSFVLFFCFMHCVKKLKILSIFIKLSVKHNPLDNHRHSQIFVIIFQAMN